MALVGLEACGVRYSLNTLPPTLTAHPQPVHNPHLNTLTAFHCLSTSHTYTLCLQTPPKHSHSFPIACLQAIPRHSHSFPIACLQAIPRHSHSFPIACPQALTKHSDSFPSACPQALPRHRSALHAQPQPTEAIPETRCCPTRPA
jgi:hypothetical protein